MTALPDGYYAVLDPADPTVMTYWRARNDCASPWPRGVHYGPLFFKKDAPPKSDRDAYAAHFEKCSAERRTWNEALCAAIEADPIAAQARFAALTTSCCACGRALTDPATKVAGIGPECRAGVPDAVLEALAAAVSLAHAGAQK